MKKALLIFISLLAVHIGAAKTATVTMAAEPKADAPLLAVITTSAGRANTLTSSASGTANTMFNHGATATGTNYNISLSDKSASVGATTYSGGVYTTSKSNTAAAGSISGTTFSSAATMSGSGSKYSSDVSAVGASSPTASASSNHAGLIRKGYDPDPDEPFPDDEVPLGEMPFLLMLLLTTGYICFRTRKQKS